MKKLLITTILVSLILSSVISFVKFNKTIEELGKEVDLEYTQNELKEEGIYQPEFINNLTTDQILAFKQFGLEGVLAVKEFSEETKIIFEKIGGMPEFQEIFRLFGYHQIIPVLWWHWNNIHQEFVNKIIDSEIINKTINYFEVKSTFDEYLKPTPIVRVATATLNIKEMGNEYLARFDFKGKKALPHNIKTLISMGSNFLASGLKKYESKLIKGESISFGDQCEAGLDVALIFTPVFLKWFSRAGKVGKEVKVAEEVMKVEKTSRAYRMAATFGKVIPYRTASKIVGKGIIIYGAYLAVTNPALVNKTLAFIAADLLGIPPVYVQIFFWTIISMLIFWIVIMLTYPLKLAYRLSRPLIIFLLTVVLKKLNPPPSPTSETP